MARRASVRYYASRKAYFTHFEGRQIKLAEGPDAAPEGPTYQNMALRTLVAAFNRAKGQGLIAATASRTPKPSSSAAASGAGGRRRTSRRRPTRS